MPVPTTFANLSTTIASNSPAGSDNTFPDLDNYLRALSGMLASVYANSGNGWTSPYLPIAGGTVTGATTFSSTLTGSGATTFSSTLTLSGTTSISGTANYTSATVPVNGFYLPAANSLGVATNSTERVRVDSSGNVGIGTTSPTQLFQVGKFDRSGIVYQRISGTVADIYLGQSTSTLFGADSATCSYVFQDSAGNYSMAVGTLGTGALIFGTNNTERARIDSSGNVITNVTGTAPTLAANSQMVFSLTSNTNLRISVRGTDGVTRVANITLA